MTTLNERITKLITNHGAMRPTDVDRHLKLKAGRAGTAMWDMEKAGKLAKRKEGRFTFYGLPDSSFESDTKTTPQPEPEHPPIIANAVDAVVALSNENARLKAALQQAYAIIGEALEASHG